ncbi:MAG TPA: ParB/RepB/Spo0J family partition protein [Burkholderiaceae bacterium]|nr:ParB/RepB/Spo0J family partition protein [Burkholderiaceae bacterium]
MKRNKGLGRGLDALLGGESTSTVASTGTLPLEQLRPGKYQPRTSMNPESLHELAESIKAQGVMQPVLVRAVPEGYEIIAGERRVRAAAIAGLHEVPVIIKQVPDNAALAMALIENIQREDLNPLEEAHGVQRLIREFDYTHEQAAQAIGRSRSATSNLLRLTNLAAPVQQMVLEGKLDMGHARALLALSAAQQIQLGNRIAAEQLSVRAAEALVARGGGTNARKPSKRPERARDIVRLEDELADTLGADVRLEADARGKGELTIRFASLDQLEGIVARLRR